MSKSAFYLAPLTLLLISPLFSETHLNLIEEEIAENDSNFHDQITLSDFLEASPESGALAQSESGNPAPTPQTIRRINSKARPPLKNGLNLWLVGEALLWQANEENLGYVQRTNSSDPTLSTDHTMKDLHFEWDWGFRVGLGYNAPRDGWDFSLTWTHIENHASGTQQADLAGSGKNSFLQPTWNVNDIGIIGILQKAHASWSIHLEQVDLGIGREYYIGKYLTIRPNGGLRADWIDQDYNVNYTSFDVFPEKLKMHNKFFGFGFFGGVDTDWIFGKGFSLYGNAAYAIVFGFFDVDQKIFQRAPMSGTAMKGTVYDSFRCGRSIIDLSLGLKWSHLFHHSSWGITLKAGYEYHLYFDQNAFLFPTTGSNYSKSNGDLDYQGVSISAQLDF